MGEIKTDSNIRVSIVIVAYNCEDVIEECIISCLQEIHAEIVVIDNASTDRTVAIVSPYVNEHLTLVTQTVNLGFTVACNIGISQAHGKYILLFNPDAMLQPGTLGLLCDYLDNHTDIGAVAPYLYFPDGRFQNYTRRFPSIRGLWVETFVPMKYWHFFKSYRQYTCQDIDFNSDQQVEQPAGAALLFRNRWLLDETYFIYGSDVDLCKTIVDDGYKIVQVAGAKVTHHQSKGGTGDANIRLFLDLDNYYGMYYFFKKHQYHLKAYFYKSLFGISLFFRTIISLFTSIGQVDMRWRKFVYFLGNRNFKAIYESK